MTEAAFPLLGTVFVMLVVLPACALAAKACLLWLERNATGGPLHGLPLRYLLLTGSSALPLAWLLSAGLHQVESGQSELACLFEHHAASLCFEPGYFALALLVAVTVSARRALRKQRPARECSSDAAARLMGRLHGIVASHPSLADLLGRVRVARDEDFAIGTQGLLTPCVMVGTSFADGVSDEMLASALGHEREHVRALDPLRYLILQLALAANPLGRGLLEPHVARWVAAREAHCDREAVMDGAAPLPLADAIVRAARPGVHGLVAQAPLGTQDVALLKFRVGLLLAFAEKPPARCCRQEPSAFPMAVALLLVALLLPHQTSTAALDALHSGTEHALRYLWR